METEKPSIKNPETGRSQVAKRLWQYLFHRESSGWYVAVILIAVIGGTAYSIRANGIFACQTLDYESDHYLAYCQADQFGDYDHGAFWFNLEPDAVRSASEARVLFIGNSRMQFGLSTDVLDEWFSSHSLSYYLMGFSHMENHTFVEPLMKRLKPTADIFIVNVDLFFEFRKTSPAEAVMNDPESLNRYYQKRRWQKVQKFLCGFASFICRDEIAFFRARSTGAWVRTGGDARFSEYPVTLDTSVDDAMFSEYARHARKFLAGISRDGQCIILTNTPQSTTSLGTAKALAERLELPLSAPLVSGLATFDKSHMDLESASRWSARFVESLEPHLRNCLDGNFK